MAGWDFLNLYDADKIYKEEAGSLNDKRTKIDYDFGDNARWLGAALLWRGDEFSRETLTKKAAAVLEKDINNLAAGDRQTIRESLGGTNVNLDDLKIKPGETAVEYEARKSGLLTRGAAATRLSQVEDSGQYLNQINDNTTTQQINALTTAAQTAARDKADKKVTDRADKLRKEQNERADDLTAAANQRQDDLLERQDIREERRDARASLERAENRRLTAETNQMNLQLKYAQLAANDRYRREDKKEKALLALLNGLGNLGAAFTI